MIEGLPRQESGPEALYYLAMTYQELGANDWATEKPSFSPKNIE